jgi:hypothetical protein
VKVHFSDDPVSIPLFPATKAFLRAHNSLLAM